MLKKSGQFYNMLYIYGSILIGPLSLMIGLGSTSGVGDDGDSSYVIEDGIIDIQKRNYEYIRARNIVYILAGAGVLAGIATASTIILEYKKGSMSKHACVIRLLLTLFMIFGYSLALYFATVWFKTI